MRSATVMGEGRTAFRAHGSAYFDITDMVRYVAAHAEVSGIQRVQLRLLGECRDDPRAGEMRCIVRHAPGGVMRVHGLSELITGRHEEDLRRLLAIAGGVRRWPVPSRALVRRCLNRSGAAGWRRAMRKGGIYVRAALAPWSLPSEMDAAGDAALGAVSTVRALPHDAALVMLGTGWTDRQAMSVAEAHRRQGGEVVALMYDLLPVTHPDWFERGVSSAFAAYLPKLLDVATSFVCISRSTEEDLRHQLSKAGRGIPTCVVPLAHEYHGFPRNSPDRVPAASRSGFPGRPQVPYVLCVGTLEVRKNGEALLDAWLALERVLGASTPHLVMCGRRGWKIASFLDKLASSEWLKSRVHILPGTDDATLADLYRKSLFTVYPSLGEGWGLPIGEAAWFGRVCITSPTSSMPEVLAERAEYADPHDPAELAQLIQKAVTDGEWLRAREQALAHVELRTWRDVARDFLDAVHVAGRRGR